MKLIPSPCKSICKFKDEVCVGCHRTQKEVVAWPKLSNEQRKEIVDRIKKETPTS